MNSRLWDSMRRHAVVVPLDAEAGSALVQVYQHAAAALGDGAERVAHQPAAIATGRAEDVAVKAARMHAHQHAFLPGHVAAHQRQVILGVEIAGVGDGTEFAELGLDASLRPRAARNARVFRR